MRDSGRRGRHSGVLGGHVFVPRLGAAAQVEGGTCSRDDESQECGRSRQGR